MAGRLSANATVGLLDNRIVRLKSIKIIFFITTRDDAVNSGSVLPRVSLFVLPFQTHQLFDKKYTFVGFCHSYERGVGELPVLATSITRYTTTRLREQSCVGIGLKQPIPADVCVRLNNLPNGESFARPQFARRPYFSQARPLIFGIDRRGANRKRSISSPRTVFTYVPE